MSWEQRSDFRGEIMDRVIQDSKVASRTSRGLLCVCEYNNSKFYFARMHFAQAKRPQILAQSLHAYATNPQTIVFMFDAQI